ncbi:hypothetical protein C922_05158 [Plasmodium inui San Antonio 1]|uniref:Uncharacterized protein n=1 Tax=Plasmodium inui San Antonio 1 TaxID=1237626 RepID=W6ZYV3_9APIC|nr:hypothetical protein C922_05158 [Plasmodium inui San Antonio 1]EUD64470.1 hypothetical protein C922_05158 [Plasmodium inui San Antonio 1]
MSDQISSMKEYDRGYKYPVHIDGTRRSLRRNYQDKIEQQKHRRSEEQQKSDKEERIQEKEDQHLTSKT